LKQENSSRLRTVAPGEIIYTEGFVGHSAIYVIAEGKVEISARCDERRVVLATLGKGECFGESALLPSEPRGSTAKALSFCRLSVIDANVVEEELEQVSPLLRHMLRTLIRRNKRKDELLATYTNADFLPGVVSYAHVLNLMACAEPREGRARRVQSEEISLALSDVLKKCQAIAGHPRVHVMAMLKRMEKLNLIALETGRLDYLGNSSTPTVVEDSATGRQIVTFDPVRVIERAQKVGDHDLDIAIAGELELIELSDLEALIGVERQLILDKLSRAEIAEDIFAFRRSKVLTYIEDNGVQYFSKKRRTAAEVESLSDLDLVDDRLLFDTVSAFDTYDLAKLLSSATDPAVSERLLSVMTKARQSETSWIMRRDLVISPAEIQEIEYRFIQQLKSIKAAQVAPVAPADTPAQFSMGS
jgi:CRP-like cAMP-binding protein